MKHSIFFPLLKCICFKTLNVPLTFFLAVVFSAFVFNVLLSQNQPSRRTLFQDAEYFLSLGEYEEALSLYMKIYNTNPQNANINYRIGLCYLNIPGYKTKAIPFLEFASYYISPKFSRSSLNEENAPPQALFLLGTAYHVNNEFSKAFNAFNEYKKYINPSDSSDLEYIDLQISSLSVAEKLMRQPLNIEYRAISDIIPQKRPNFNPVMSANGEVIAFSTKEKFYTPVSIVKKKGSNWGNIENIDSMMIQDGKYIPASLSFDGTLLFLVKTDDLNSDIFFTRFENGSWSSLQKLNNNINTRYWETSASISSDGNILYFSSNRNGGSGNLDIYKSLRNEKGDWGPAINLGQKINTSYNEDNVVITENDSILFFSSQGHYNMGGYDIFKSFKQDNDSWSSPVNIGYPLNTTDDDRFYFPYENGNKALYAGIIKPGEPFISIKDIRFYTPEILRKIILKGILAVKDAPDKPDHTFLVSVRGKNSETTIFNVVPRNITGAYSLQITPGEYFVSFSGSGYLSKTEKINIPPDFPGNEYILNSELLPVEPPVRVSVLPKHILFDFDSYQLNQQAQSEVNLLFELMKRNNELRIELTGNTDSKGHASYNLELSRKRAVSIAQYLASRGIDPSRCVTKGLGEEFNIAINTNTDGTDNPEGRSINRNVEINIPESKKYHIKLEPVLIPEQLRVKINTR